MYAIDHNVDHFAGWLVDRHGNPVGAPDRFPIDNSGSAPRRDAQVRHVISRIIRRAQAAGVEAVAIEDLGFETEREDLGWGGRSGRGFRRAVAGMPTASFPARLAAMTDRAGLTVIAVDPRYTSKWGARYWQRPTSTSRHQTSRHEAAAIVIGRRALGLGARRRIEKPAPRQRTEASGPSGPDGAETHPSARVRHQSWGGLPVGARLQDEAPEGTLPRPTPPKTVRGGASGKALGLPRLLTGPVQVPPRRGFAQEQKVCYR